MTTSYGCTECDYTFKVDRSTNEFSDFRPRRMCPECHSGRIIKLFCGKPYNRKLALKRGVIL